MKLMKGRGRWMLVVVGVLVALATAGYVYSTNRTPAGRYRTAAVDRGTIVATVSATGQLNAVTTVQVGSQVSGLVKEVLVDFNSPVRKDQLVARIETDVFQAKVNAAVADLDSTQAQVLNQRANVEKVRADVENARAAVATADANVERMRADVENARATIATAQANVTRDSATMSNARIELDRRVELIKQDLISKSERDLAQTTYDTAQAQLEATRAQERAGQAALRSSQAQLTAGQSQARAAVAQVSSVLAALQVAEAQLKSAEATVRQKQAAVEQARLDLVHTEIRAPVDGVVVSRAVDPGQTVAASLQAPTLFTIAQDLTRMQVEAAVDEADVGRLREGMGATFTVDAFPGRTFSGEISQIRKAAQVVSNVVSYTTIITVSNADLTLLPGMTANVRIQTDRRNEALRVANAALRFRPLDSADAGSAARPRAGSDDGSGRSQAGGAGRPGGGGAAGGAGGRGPGGGSGGGGGLREMRTTLVRDLALTQDQQTKLDAILEEARQAFAVARSQGGNDQAAGDAQRRRARSEVRDKIRAILTPDQQKKFDALQPAPDGGTGGVIATAARVYVAGVDGKPQAVAIMIGLSDGTYSEVVSGDLKAGQEVLVGTGGGAAGRASGTPGGGPRLRL
jgi:HlyD family secretion protein